MLTRKPRRAGVAAITLDRAGQDDGNASVLGVSISHPERPLWPEEGVTKLDLAQYFAAVGDRMLPLAGGRPIMMYRCPQGRGTVCFYQKHYEEAPTAPPGLHTVKIKESEGLGTYLVLDKPAGLVSLVQRNVVEIHTWGCRDTDLDRPDRIIFDLDPGPGVTWPRLRDAAVLFRDHLEAIGLESFVKTSGGKGLHVMAPLTPKANWEQIKAFTRAMAMEVAQERPDEYVAVMTKTKREGKIFIDYLRNQTGATTVAAYSVRARPGAHVSVPLSWKELAAARKLPEFTMAEAVARVKKPDPWAAFPKTRQALPAKILKALSGPA
jgi:bifunctional non-homologous end joining protein LigD